MIYIPIDWLINFLSIWSGFVFFWFERPSERKTAKLTQADTHIFNNRKSCIRINTHSKIGTAEVAPAPAHKKTYIHAVLVRYEDFIHDHRHYYCYYYYFLFELINQDFIKLTTRFFFGFSILLHIFSYFFAINYERNILFQRIYSYNCWWSSWHLCCICIKYSLSRCECNAHNFSFVKKWIHPNNISSANDFELSTISILCEKKIWR